MHFCPRWKVNIAILHCQFGQDGSVLHNLWQEICDVTHQTTELGYLFGTLWLRPVNDAICLSVVRFNAPGGDMMSQKINLGLEQVGPSWVAIQLQATQSCKDQAQIFAVFLHRIRSNNNIIKVDVAYFPNIRP